MSASEQLGLELVNNIPAIGKDAQTATRRLNALAKAADKLTSAMSRVPTGSLPALTGPVAINPSSVRSRGAGGGGGGKRAPSTPASRIVNALMSTRLNLGHASPLIGQSLKALGVGAEAAAPVLILAGAVAAAAHALYQLASTSAELGNTFGRFADQTGSYGRSGAQLQLLGSSSNVDTASIANAIQERITSDPTGMAAGLRLGAHNLPGPYGSQDFGSQAITVVGALRKITNVMERLRMARAVGAEGLMPLTRLGGNQFRLVSKDAGIRSGIMSPEFLQKSADFQSSLGRLQESFQNLIAAVGMPAMQQLTTFFNNLASTLNVFAGWLSKHQGLVSMITSDAEGAAGLLLNGAVAMSGGNDAARALDENTKATNNNTAILGKPGFYGKSTRGDSMPGGWNGWSMAAAGDLASIHLSAF